MPCFVTIGADFNTDTCFVVYALQDLIIMTKPAEEPNRAYSDS